MHVLLKMAGAIAITATVAACATRGDGKSAASTASTNPRIEYRSLLPDAASNDMRAKLGAAMSSSGRPEGTQTPSAVQRPVHLDFDNDSATLDVSKIDFAPLKRANAQGLHFFVVGQSHGASSVGVQTLAAKRAQAVGQALKDGGIGADRIHLLASWGTTRDAFAPSRGVQVYMLEPSSDPSRALLALQGS